MQKQFKNLSIKVDTKVINTNGTGTEASELPNLSDYDLIYINGKLSSNQALNIAATTKLPAIINQETAMGTDTDKEVMEEAFAAYVDADYEKTKTPYVSQRIYFTDGNLCNLNFYTDFTEDEMTEFSEITDYIKSENNYREVIETGENGEKTDPLATNISQARVVEYIINYKYKRDTPSKSTVNVLDIEPASATASLTTDNVKKWLGLNGNTNTESAEEKQRGTIKDYCCQERTDDGKDAGEKTNGGIDKVLDGDKDTYWHSLYSKNINGNKKTPHWFEYKLSSQDRTRTLTGIRFVAKKGYSKGDLNGRPYKLELEVHKINGKVITETATFSETTEELQQWNQNGFQKEYTFKNPIKKVDYIKVTFVETYSNPAGEKNGGNYKSTEFATCAEFSTLYQTSSTPQKDVTVNITHMTSSEFVGHIDDINTEYDAIYFGDSYNNWNFLRNGDLDDNNQKTSLYAHTGGVFGGKKDQVLSGDAEGHRWLSSRLMGLLDIDYTTYNNKKYLRSPNFTKGTIGEKIGRMLGSGNDITSQQVKELEDFVSSGYPVIIGDRFLNSAGTSVNTNVVDSSSYMYQFFSDIIGKERVNVMSKSEADKKENLNFFFYLSKPEIKFTQMPPEPERLNDSSYRYNKEAEKGNIKQNQDGLEYTFTIKNNSEISTANATYNCELFIDLNFDGNLSTKEEQSEYMQIQDASGNVVRKENGKYHLKLGKQYTLTRKIPKDYYKVITWKLQISNNDNPSIRTSRTGFTKREAGAKQKMNVLQIYPNRKEGYDAYVTWRLDEDTSFKSMLDQVTDFDIKITAKNTTTYVNDFAEAKKQNKNLLDNYQMIIIGFADGFGVDNIPNENGEVDAIRQFIADGKSVLFSHDTTSFVNTAKDVNREGYCLYNEVNNNFDKIPDAWNWGYSLNTYLRASVGMDRYGITSDSKVIVNGEDSSVSKELKKGNDLTKNDGVFEAIKDKVSDMAYTFGNKNKSSFMTQGFANNILDNKNHKTKKASKVNEGAITEYPYHISDKISTAITHSQYYQLALEEDSDSDGTNDIVVWYCLADDDSTYKESPNDVRNNYYFYSKGNVIYTGVGHAGNGHPSYEGNPRITDQERQLFANAVIAAANVTAVDPEATFLDGFDPVSNQEDYRYYMPDRLKTSEVSVTNILDGDNTFNIRIRDYNMVAANLNNKSNNSGSLTMELYIDDPDSKDTVKINGTDKKVRKISVEGKTDDLKKYSDGKTIHVDNKGVFKLPGNDTFQFSLKDMESYLKNADGTYRKECNIYAKVESTVTLYGTTANKVTWTSISLKPRQLFDLD